MTIDERLEFLLQSTESLLADGQQLHDTVRQNTTQIRDLSIKMLETDAKIGINAETIRNLGEMARNHQDHINGHEERLDELEGPAA